MMNRYQFLEPGKHKIALVINSDVENNRLERTFEVLPARPITPSFNSQKNNSKRPKGGFDNNDIQNETSARPLTDYIEKGKTENNSQKALLLSDNKLRIAILNINNSGFNEIKSYLLNNNFSNCMIVFNGHPIDAEQLKENVKYHIQYGKDLTVKQETDAKNHISSIEIKAELKPREKVLGVFKKKEYRYPY
jgi:hypothetical protein